ncbi:MAG: AI-2E family transporter [Gammaproteobacteria bacterium]|nr:MAG: AI-2E family transporter [Gammaproteobacteria bacterium]
MFEIFRQWYDRTFSDPQALLLAALLIIGTAVVLLAGQVLAPILAAMVLAYILDGAVIRLTRWNIPRKVAVWIVFTAFVALVVAILVWLAPLLIRQAGQFLVEVPRMIAKGQDLLMELPARYPTLISEEDISRLIAQVRVQLAGVGKLVLSSSLSSVVGLITAMVYLILVPVLIFFFLYDKDKLFRWATSFLPEDRPLAVTVWKEMDLKISSYARGKLLEIAFVWVVSWVAFSLLGLNYAVLLSLIVGLSVLIPYVGAAAVTLPVALIAYYQWGLDIRTAWVLVAYGVIQFFDGNLLAPLLFAEAVNIHPIAIITAVLFFGGLWGVWGVFFAIPLATLIQTILEVWPRQESTVATGK